MHGYMCVYRQEEGKVLCNTKYRIMYYTLLALKPHDSMNNYEKWNKLLPKVL